MSWKQAFVQSLLWILVIALIIAVLFGLVIALEVLPPLGQGIIIFLILWCVTTVAIKTAP